jgi:hypothetical protein
MIDGIGTLLRASSVVVGSDVSELTIIHAGKRPAHARKPDPHKKVAPSIANTHRTQQE